MYKIIVFTTFLLSINALWNDARINVLGSGWDILENEPRESFFVLDSDNNTQGDFKIPNGVVVIANPESESDWYSEIITTTHISSNSKKMDFSVSDKLWKISGSFSKEKSRERTLTSRQNHVVVKTTANIKLTTYELQTASLNLSLGLHTRIQKIINIFRKNTIVSGNYIKYLIDEILNIFGTHFVIRHDSGGILVKMDAVDSSLIDTKNSKSVKKAGSLSFGKHFGLKAGSSRDSTLIDTYESAISSQYSMIYGGDPWKTNDSYSQWIESLKYNPGIIYVKLIPIMDVIRQQYFQDLTFSETLLIRRLFLSRIEDYLSSNYYKGCGNPNSEHFVSYVNVFDDNLCNHQNSTNFGGTYSISSDNTYNVDNIATRTTSCPRNYQSVLLLNNTFKSVSGSHQHCHKIHHKRRCYTEYFYKNVIVETYMCLSNETTTNQVYFGGIYSNEHSNDVTGDNICPPDYVGVPIYTSSDKKANFVVCQATTDTKTWNVGFDGVFSNQVALFSSGEFRCRDGFEKHRVVSQGYELSYCISIGSLSNEEKDRIPPGYYIYSESDMFDLFGFENGTRVGVNVDPGVGLDYFSQVFVNAAAIYNETSETDSYLEKWYQGIKDTNDQIDVDNDNPVVFANENHFETSVENTKTIIILSVTVAMMGVILIAIIVILIYVRVKKYRYNRLNSDAI